MTNDSFSWGYLYKLEALCTLTLAKNAGKIFNYHPSPLGIILSPNLGF